MVWCGMYGMVWYGMVWYGMVWYGMVWYGVVCMVWYGSDAGNDTSCLDDGDDDNFSFVQDHVNDLQAQADKFIEKEHHEATTIKEEAETMTTRYEKYELHAIKKRE